VTAVATSGCKPNLDDTVSIVTSPEIVAVRSDPAEAPPNGTVSYTALDIGPAGPVTSGAIEWDYCNAREPLAELRPVSALCYEASGSWFASIGLGTQVTGTIGATACRNFGPDVPPPMGDQPPGRPVDPDPTGGYYQPVRTLSNGEQGEAVDIGFTRLSCGLTADAPADSVTAFAQRYHANNNPLLASFGPQGQAGWIDDDEPGHQGMTNSAAAGARLDLEAAWPACPLVDICGDGTCGPDETPASCASCDSSVVVCAKDCAPLLPGCQGAERYVVFDQPSAGLLTEREAISIAWYATGGAFDADRTGRDGTDPTTTSDNGWVAPSSPGPVTMWVVIRDDRGGVGWHEYVIDLK
jgi:hypothetical protein